jgi:hypothetical protein
LWKAFKILLKYEHICKGIGQKGVSKLEILQMEKLMRRAKRLPPLLNPLGGAKRL